MKNNFILYLACCFILSLTMAFQSCSEQDWKPDSNWVVYDEGQKLTFTDTNSKDYIATVNYIEQGHAVLTINEFMPIHTFTQDGDVNLWIEFPGMEEQFVSSFPEERYLSQQYPTGYYPALHNLEINGQEYNRLVIVILFDGKKLYNVYSKENRGIVAIVERDNEDGFVINR